MRARSIEELTYFEPSRPRGSESAAAKFEGCRASTPTLSILQMQRDYGNRYVQRLVTLAKQTPTCSGPALEFERAVQPASGQDRHLLQRAPLDNEEETGNEDREIFDSLNGYVG